MTARGGAAKAGLAGATGTPYRSNNSANSSTPRRTDTHHSYCGRGVENRTWTREWAGEKTLARRARLAQVMLVLPAVVLNLESKMEISF